MGEALLLEEDVLSLHLLLRVALGSSLCYPPYKAYKDCRPALKLCQTSVTLYLLLL